MVYRSGGGTAGPAYDRQQDILYHSGKELAAGEVRLFTGNVVIPWPDGTSLLKDRGANIIIQNKSVYPMLIQAIVPSMQSSA